MSVDSGTAPPEYRLFGALVAASDGAVCGNGRQRAEEAFIKAIIHYSRFQAIHLFVVPPSDGAAPCRWQALVDDAGPGRVELLPSRLLADYLGRYHYSVFHTDTAFFAELTGLRARYGRELFPLTARAHTLNGDADLSWPRDLLLSPVAACDALLCRSHAQRQALVNLLDMAGGTLSALKPGLAFAGQLGLLPAGIDGDSGGDERTESLLRENTEQPIAETIKGKETVKETVKEKETVKGTIKETVKETIEETLATQSESGSARQLLRDHLGLPQEAVVLLCAGSGMDFHPLLLAANDLLEERGISEFILVLAGCGKAAGEAVQSLLRLAGDLNLERHLRLELSVDARRREALYQAADLFISLADTVQDSADLTPLEAMSHGLPVILTDWNDHGALLGDGQGGILLSTVSACHDRLTGEQAAFQPHLARLLQGQGTAINQEALVNGLDLLIRNRAWRLQMGQAARQRAYQHYHWRRVIARYHKLAESLYHEACDLSLSRSVRPGFSVTRAFGHYSTRTLTDSHYLLSTDRGVRVVLGLEKTGHCQAIEHLLEPQGLRAIILFCCQSRSQAELRRHIALTKPAIERNLTFIVLWLSKYQLLSIATSRSTAPAEPGDRAFAVGQERLHFQAVAVAGIDPQRQALLAPVLDWLWLWLKDQLSSCPVADPGGTLLASLLACQVPLVDDKTVQAMAWFAQDHGLPGYQATLSVLAQQGGLRALARAYPGWFRLGKKMLLGFCRGIRHLFRRVQGDLDAINRCFAPLWAQPATRVVSLELPSAEKGAAVVIIGFDNNQRLVYKSRDIRIDGLIVGDGDDSLAPRLNGWLGDFPGLGCYRMLPRMEHLGRRCCHYGYSAFIAERPPRGMAEIRRYHQRLGVITGVALLLGLSDLHPLNVRGQGDTPYLTDLEKAFHGPVFRALEQELDNPAMAFIKGLEDSSFARTRLPDLWRTTCERRVRLCDVQVDGDCFQPMAEQTGTIVPPVAGSMVQIEPLIEGLEQVIHCLGQHQDQWLTCLDRCRALALRFQPMVGQPALVQALQDLHTFRGFQSFSSARTRRYLHRLATRLCLTGQEDQRWLEAVWREPLLHLAGTFVAPWLAGQTATLVRCGSRVFCRQGLGNLRPACASSQAYFQVDTFARAGQLFVRLQQDQEVSRAFIRHFRTLLQRAQASAAN